MHVNQLFVCLYYHNIRIMLLQFRFITITLSSLMYFSEFLDQLLLLEHLQETLYISPSLQK